MALAINIGILFLALFSLLASFNPQWHIWGIDSFRMFPIALRLILVGALIISIIPPISRRLGNAIYEGMKSLTKKKATWLYLFISMLLVALFVIFSSKNHLLGDGYLLVGNMADGISYFSFTEPLEHFLHFTVFRVIGGGQQGALLSYALCAYLAGAIFLIGLFKFVENKKNLLLALAVVFTFGTVQFFFGYVENYTYSFVFAFLYLSFAIKDFNKKEISLPTVLFFLLAVGFHLMYAVLAPSLVYLLLNKYRSRWLLMVSLIASAMLIVGGLIFLDKFMGLSSIFVPILATSNYAYLFISTAHLADLLNYFLLNYPLIFIIPFGQEWRKTKGVSFLAIAFAGTLFFTAFVDPKIGAIRDWDLMAIASAPIMVFILQFLLSRSDILIKETYRIFLPLILFALIHSGSWVWQNTHKNETYIYIKEVIHQDLHYTEDYYRGERNKSWGFFANVFYGDQRETVRAYEKRFKGCPEDGVNARSLACQYLLVGDSARARNFVQDNWKRYVKDPYVVIVMSNVLIQTNNSSGAERMLEGLIAAGYADYNTFHNLAVIKMLRGKTDSAFYLFDLSMKNNHDASIDLEFSFYLSAFNEGLHNIVQLGLNRILDKLNPADGELAKRILEAEKDGDKKKIDSLKSVVSRREDPSQ